MNSPFLQIHSLHGYTAVLLNRDDAKFAKRLMYGNTVRTRVSSQCLKRHWRMAEGPYALRGIDGVPAAVRSRDTVSKRVIGPLSGYDKDVLEAIEVAFQKAVYGGGAKRQPLLLGEPEIRYLAEEARKIAEAHRSDAAGAKTAANAWAARSTENLRALRESCTLPGGVDGAVFGRMVTADVDANIEAALHVGHAFTVHAEETENDYFTVVDDLGGAPGADHVGESDLTSGLFYVYAVVDQRTLIENLGRDLDLAGQVVERLVHLIATVSPGAKRGATAPYSYASWMLIEAGECQPRSLAEAFREPCGPTLGEATQAARAHLEWLDTNYGTGEARRVMSRDGGTMPRAGEPIALGVLAAWAAEGAA